jgi:hypothetical protein
MMTPSIISDSAVSVPQVIRVRISSERAEAISMMPVVVQEMPAEDLLGHIIGLTGKNPARMSEILARGFVVSGASRLRWDGFEVLSSELDSLLALFPDPDPSRPFVPGACVQAVLHGGGNHVTVLRDVASKRRFFRGRSFWDVLIGIAGAATYFDYSYREKADVYRRELRFDDRSKLQDAASLLPFPTLATQVQSAGLDTADFFVKR